jgi:CO/xanthine dehydrogenase FAD-binding subunit
MDNELSYLLRLPKFEHAQAKTVAEACSLISKYKDQGKLIAGGTDLLVYMKRRKMAPKYLIDIKPIPGINYIRCNEEGLRIGTLATIHSIETSPLIRDRFPLLASTAHELGTPNVRNTGTIGGNLCNASPSADMAPSLIGLEAKLKISSAVGERTMALEDFFTGPGQTALQEGEMLTEIQVPNACPHTKGVYLKLPARTAVDIASVGVSVVLTMDSNIISNARIVLGAVAPTPIRVHEAEDVLRGKAIEDQLIEQASQIAAEESRPISDIRSSAYYRKEMTRTLTRRAINQAVALFR